MLRLLYCSRGPGVESLFDAIAPFLWLGIIADGLFWLVLAIVYAVRKRGRDK